MSGDIKCRGTSSVRGHQVSGDIIPGFSQGTSCVVGHNARPIQGT